MRPVAKDKPLRYLWEGLSWWLFTALPNRGGRFALTLPAVAVHLWLVLLAIGVLLAQAFGHFLRAAAWVQWFIKRGENHPLEAIGYVAAVVVLVFALIAQFVVR
jgi:hypothetical protein